MFSRWLIWIAFLTSKPDISSILSSRENIESTTSFTWFVSPNFLSELATSGTTSVDVAAEILLSSVQAIVQGASDKARCLICGDKPIPPAKGILPGTGVENLTELNLRMNEPLRSGQPRRSAKTRRLNYFLGPPVEA